METNSIQQEILLFTNTSLSQRQLSEKEALDKKNFITHTEQLTAACWKGWLEAMMPEIIDTSADGKPLFLWDILQGKSFLDIELCQSPQTIEVPFSINPYAFLPNLYYS